MKTALILMAQFGLRLVIPIEDVRREYFSHL
ncbi:pyocin activator PrtN family protein [Paraburkholderia sediminicola]